MTYQDAYVLAVMLFGTRDQLCIVRINDRFGVAIDQDEQDGCFNVQRWAYDENGLMNSWPLRTTIKSNSELATLLMEWTQDANV